MRKLIAVHCRVDDNVGDLWSPPSMYFPLPFAVEYRHIRDVRWWDFRQPMLIGGGGLLFFRERLRRIVARKRRTMIAWGIGHNEHGSGVRPDYAGYDFLDALELCGVRDRDVGRRFVPCASCMSPLLDQNYAIEHDTVVYDHARFPVPDVPADMPRLRNDADLYAVIRFLGSARRVVTTSYHGAYWATLLGREVVCLPFSSKFHAMPHPPRLVDGAGWRAALDEAQAYPQALAECRALNWDFYRDVYARLRDG